MSGIFNWLRRDFRAALSVGFLLLLLGLSIAAPVVAPHSPTNQDVNNTLHEPDARHPAHHAVPLNGVRDVADEEEGGQGRLRLRHRRG